MKMALAFDDKIWLSNLQVHLSLTELLVTETIREPNSLKVKDVLVNLSKHLSSNGNAITFTLLLRKYQYTVKFTYNNAFSLEEVVSFTCP